MAKASTRKGRKSAKSASKPEARQKKVEPRVVTATGIAVGGRRAPSINVQAAMEEAARNSHATGQDVEATKAAVNAARLAARNSSDGT